MASNSNFELALPIGANELEEGVIGKRVIVNRMLAAGNRFEMFNKVITPNGENLNPDHEESVDTESRPGYWIMRTNAFVTNFSDTLEQLTFNVHQDGRESLSDKSTYRHKPQVPTPGETVWVPVYRED